MKYDGIITCTTIYLSPTFTGIYIIITVSTCDIVPAITSYNSIITCSTINSYTSSSSCDQHRP